MRLGLCNEVLRDHDFAEQCQLAASLGYDALEIAPFTLSDDPARLPGRARARLRRIADEAGIAISGLHWLLNVPEGLSITDPARATATATHMERMVDLCADLGGTVLVHGSPAQRDLSHAPDPVTARATAAACFARAGAAAQAAGVAYCLEPLSPRLTGFLTSVAECAALLDEIGSPGLATMIDTCAAADGEAEPAEAVLARWLPTGRIAHVHLNDPDQRAPGQGAMRFGPVLSALRDGGYAGTLGVEPFRYEPNGLAAAAVAAGYLRGLRESTDA